MIIFFLKKLTSLAGTVNFVGMLATDLSLSGCLELQHKGLHNEGYDNLEYNLKCKATFRKTEEQVRLYLLPKQ